MKTVRLTIALSLFNPRTREPIAYDFLEELAVFKHRRHPDVLVSAPEFPDCWFLTDRNSVGRLVTAQSIMDGKLEFVEERTQGSHPEIKE